jgi:hypothetical protein
VGLGAAAGTSPVATAVGVVTGTGQAGAGLAVGLGTAAGTALVGAAVGAEAGTVRAGAGVAVVLGVAAGRSPVGTGAGVAPGPVRNGVGLGHGSVLAGVAVVPEVPVVLGDAAALDGWWLA